MQKLFIAATFMFCICSCSKVKNEPVRVTQTDSFSDAYVIQVNKFGKYFVYIPNESDRLEYTQLIAPKITTQDSIFEMELSDLEKSIAIYKKIIKDKKLKIKIETDCAVKYHSIKSLMKCLQGAGYTHYYLTINPK